jgi:hypothetical protein
LAEEQAVRLLAIPIPNVTMVPVITPSVEYDVEDADDYHNISSLAKTKSHESIKTESTRALAKGILRKFLHEEKHSDVKRRDRQCVRTLVPIEQLGPVKLLSKTPKSG